MTSADSHLSNVWAKETDLQVVTRRRTFRWMPVLVVTADEVSEAVSAFSSAIRATG